MKKIATVLGALAALTTIWVGTAGAASAATVHPDICVNVVSCPQH